MELSIFDRRTDGSKHTYIFVDTDPSSRWLIRMGCHRLRHNELAHVSVAGVDHDVPEEHIAFGDHEKGDAASRISDGREFAFEIPRHDQSNSTE
ncbi:hypothetical protein GW17_00016764 [Ensete ventricosum]|nr:hypothetical protein GW17_00016764 [Ensete ventricosum]